MIVDLFLQDARHGTTGRLRRKPGSVPKAGFVQPPLPRTIVGVLRRMDGRSAVKARSGGGLA